MSEAIELYLDEKRQTGRGDGRPIKPGTLVTLRFRLQAIHDDVVKLDQLTPARCRSLYDRRRLTIVRGGETVAADTHRNELQAAKTFGEWIHERGYVKSNPWKDVKPMGGRHRGKEQLRVDEARRFSETAFDAAAAGDIAAIAVLTALILGLRSSEVLARVVRDLDNDGRLLWIPDSKTEAGRRREEVPEVLRVLLVELAGARGGTEPLFPRLQLERHRGRTPKAGVTATWLRHHTARLCRAADVPRVCPHSLRGLHATLATEAGATSHLVAHALGHADRGATARAHYIKPEATRRAATTRMLDMLGGGAAGNDTGPSRSQTDPPPR